jgi:hypothetical protein
MSFLNHLKISNADFKKPSVLLLIIANLFPIYGAIFLHWQVFPILVLFWIENIVIGVFNVFKMVFVAPNGTKQVGAKVAMIPFFCVHYGIFTFVHGLFLFLIFGGFFEIDDPTSMSNVFNSFSDLHLEWAIIALVISHGFSFIENYIRKGEYKNTNLAQLMGEPYSRVVVLHITIVIGAFLVAFLGSPVVGLFLLVALKIFIDIRAHLIQHRLSQNITSDIVNS